MAGDKTYITDSNGKLHRATRTHKVTPESIVWSSNPNDYAVQVRIDGKWHRAFLTMDAGTATYFDNINIDKALVAGGDGKTHTCLICSPEASVTMSSIKTDQHSLVAGTTTGETAVNVYSENWSNVQWQDNVNVYKVLVTGSDGKVHTALLTTSVTGGVEVIIKGTSPLNLPDAIANSLSYVKAFGGTEQNGTPTPDAPIDIVSNNGVLKARHQSGLPLGYTLLEYIESSGRQWIDTGINDVDKVETELNMGGFGSYKFAFGNYSGETTDVTRFILSGSSSNIYPIANINSKAGGGSIGFSGQIFSVNSYHTVVMEDLVTEIRATVDGYSKTVEKVSGAANAVSIALFANAPNGIAYTGVGFKYWRAYKNGVLVRNMIPAKNSSGVIGMYDTVSGQFFTNQGTGDFGAGATVDDIEVYADGTVETIEDTIGNTATAEMLLKLGDYQDVQSILDGVVTRKVRVKVLDGTENWIKSNNLFYVDIATDALEDTHSCYCTHFKGVATNASASYDNEIKVGTNATQTAYWARVQTYPVVGTYSDATAFKQFLADQYAAGTPVIVIYPLATATTESVAGQTLQVTGGDNVLEITQASLTGLELEVEYQAAVSLTIQEVEDANLDNNVTVTIQ